jgi:ATP-dependent DNA helicase RecG
MLEQLLKEEESKTFECKENASNLDRIIKTVIAFANTAGGKILIGVRDKTKEIIGVKDSLQDERRLANAIADTIAPLIMPDIHIVSWRDKELILINVPHAIGPYHLKSLGLDKSTYVRLGSTNRIADGSMVLELKRLSENLCFDEIPALRCSIEDLDLEEIKKRFKQVNKKFTEASALSLKLFIKKRNQLIPTNGAILLWGKNREEIFPEIVIRCVRFLGTTKGEALDHQDISTYLPDAIDAIMNFIRRNTRLKAEFGEIRRKDIPEYPPIVIREAIINALIHADYNMTGSHVQVAIYDDRLEITNPGNLPFGLTLKEALQGVSQLRNKVIGRVFKELALIEQWGSGFRRIRENCHRNGLKEPLLEEIGYFFRITIFNEPLREVIVKGWQKELVEYLKENKTITTREAATFFKISDRASRTRLKKMVDSGLIIEIASNLNDPNKNYILK